MLSQLLYSALSVVTIVLFSSQCCHNCCIQLSVLSQLLYSALSVVIIVVFISCTYDEELMKSSRTYYVLSHK
jgi:hypothetical protein